MHVGRCLINEPRPGNQRLVTSEHLHVATCYTDIMAILIYGWHAVQQSSNTLPNTTLHRDNDFKNQTCKRRKRIYDR